MGDERKELMTEDLLQRLLESATPGAYVGYLNREGLRVDTLADYLGELMRRRGLRKSQVIRGANLNPTFGYQIFQGTRLPGRDNAIRLAFSLGCDVRETQRILRLANLSELWPRVARDSIIIWCIDRGMSRVECDEQLYLLGERTLLDEQGN